MKIIPITLKEANSFVVKYHRHHKEVVGCKFCIAVVNEGEIKGVAICGRPVSRKLDNGLTVEVNRLCVNDIKNGCSKLYSACARIAKEIGFERIITYILKSETGISLKASGWNLDCDSSGGKQWNSSKIIIRTSETVDLFGTHKKYPSELKQRWIKNLTGRPKNV